MAKTTTLRRELDVGETLSLDDGRVAITLEGKSGRKARFKLEIQSWVRVDKPNMASNGIFSSKSLAKLGMVN